MRGLLLAAAASAALSSCAGAPVERKEVLIDRSGIDVVGAPADSLHVIIKDQKSLERFCKGPGPDMALTANGGITIGGNLPVPAAPGAKIGESTGRGALDLGGRNPAVLIARELLYRACELVINTNANPKTAIAIFKMTMDAIERISALQVDTGAVATAAAPPASYADLPDTITSSVSTTTATGPQLLGP